jgi:hypothetical protein
MKLSVPGGEKYTQIKQKLRELKLHTVWGGVGGWGVQPAHSQPTHMAESKTRPMPPTS